METPEARANRGMDAERLLDNPLFRQAFEDTRSAITATWARLPENKERSEYSHDLHRMMRALDKVERCIREYVTTGKLAQREIEGTKNLFGRRR